MFFKISTPRILAFLKKLSIFHFFQVVIIQVFQPKKESPLGFDNKVTGKCFWQWISFQLLSQSLAVFNAICDFQVF